MVKYIKDLVKIISVSGHEEKIADYIAEKMKPYFDEVYKDALGNLICPNNTVAACATVGEVGHENKVMHKTFVAYAIVLVLYMTLATLYTLVLFPNFGM